MYLILFSRHLLRCLPPGRAQLVDVVSVGSTAGPGPWRDTVRPRVRNKLSSCLISRDIGISSLFWTDISVLWSPRCTWTISFMTCWRREGIQPADELPYGVIVETGATIEAVRVDGTGWSLVCLGRRVPDGDVGGVRAGPRYVGGLAGVDTSVPGTNSGHRQSRSFPVRDWDWVTEWLSDCTPETKENCWLTF